MNTLPYYIVELKFKKIKQKIEEDIINFINRSIL